MTFKFDEKLGKYSPVNSRTFHSGDNGTDNLANNHWQHIELFHLPSSYFILFKAFLTNFSDAYASEWKKSPVYGRMDNIATFVRTTRIISVEFQTVAASVQEAEENMTRISLLLQMLYPSFDSEALQAQSGDRISTIKGSPLFKIKFMNWIKGTSEGKGGAVQEEMYGDGDARSSGLLGYLDGVTFAPDLEPGVFQAGFSIFPKVVNLAFTFNVIHEHPLGWESDDKNKNKLTANPRTAGFPYGQNIEFDKERVAPMTSKQKKSFKRLQAAQKSVMTAGKK